MAARSRLNDGQRARRNCVLELRGDARDRVIAPAYGMMSSLGSGMQALSMPIRSAMPAVRQRGHDVDAEAAEEREDRFDHATASAA